MLRKFALAISLGVLACACQAILGDFTVEPAPAVEPAPVLGTACGPEEYRCTDAALERCADDRRGFVVVEICTSASECNLNAKACRPCMAGEFMCRGAALERCENSAWQSQENCETPGLCKVDPDLLGGECVMPSQCAAGAHVCDGPRLLRCSNDRDGSTDFVALCGSTELCDAAHADSLVEQELPARCLPAECGLGSFSCDGAMLRRCSPDRLRWVDQSPCDSPDLCSAGRGTCGACTPDEVECNGAELRRCTETGSWQTLDTCDNAALCDAEGERCREAQCDEPGAFRCSDLPELEICSDDLLWTKFQRCATAALCNASAGRCLAPACAAGEKRCRNGLYEACSGDRTRWVVEATCGVGQRCEVESGCVQGTCMEGELSCNGSSLERCVAGQSEILQRCATATLCVAGTTPGCTAPVCDPGPVFDCRGPSIVTECAPGRDGFDDYLTCTGAKVVCDDGFGSALPECDTCIADEYRCDELELVRCSADGQVWQPVQSCPTSCMVTGTGAPDCR